MRVKSFPLLVLCLSLSTSTLQGTAPLAQTNPPPSQPALGMNLSGPADYMTELPFVDAFKTSRPWISQREGAGWEQGPPLSLDTRGWVTALEPGLLRGDAHADHRWRTLPLGPVHRPV